MSTKTRAKAAAAAWLDETWHELRNGAGAQRTSYFTGAVDVLTDLGVLTAEEQDAWIERRNRCPGHDDEVGRSWCAYGCKQESTP